jgi:two-component system CheB/CheR fusion protein
MRLNDDEVFGVLRDVTEQTRNQQALIASKQRIQDILSALPDMIGRCDREGTLLEIIHEGTFKRTRSGASNVDKPLETLIPPEKAHYIRQRLAQALDTQSIQLVNHMFVIEGENHYRELRYVPLEDDTCLVLFRDISEEKRSQRALAASEQQMRAIFSVLPDVIAYFDRAGVHLGNIHTGNLPVGVPHAAVLNKPFAAWLATAEAERLQASLEQAFMSQREQVSHYSIDIDGVTYHRDIRFVYFNEDTCLGLIRDVTEAHAAKQALQAALEHSQALLQEVHHQVRNNLQMLSSLLQLHAGTLTDEVAKHALKENRRRIQTLALVHRVLYDNESYASIALDTFLEEALALFGASIRRRGITVELHTEPIAADLDCAIPFGLIVNELLSNVLEHAFAKGTTTSSLVQIYLRQDKQTQRVTLHLIDNGSGVPDTLPTAPNSLGMMIINLLTEQLNGHVEIASVTDNGVTDNSVTDNGVVQGGQTVLEFPLRP